MRWFKVWRHKRALNNAWHKATRFHDYMDCGRQLARYINPAIAIAEEEDDDIADQLVELGEKVPPFRFTTTTEKKA